MPKSKVLENFKTMSKDTNYQRLHDNAKQKNIIDVIGNHVNLKKAGANYVALCPLHEEKTASLTIFTKSNTFHCFGCGKGGDGIAFIIQHLNYSYIEALEHITGEKVTGYVAKRTPHIPKMTIEMKYSDALELCKSRSELLFNCLFQDFNTKEHIVNYLDNYDYSRLTIFQNPTGAIADSKYFLQTLKQSK